MPASAIVGPQEPPKTALALALIFTFIFLLHAPLLRLPYFWDEAGYFVPAARDLLLTGDPIPQSTLSNAHPPLVMAWLALAWKLGGYSPAVTRTAMLLVAAFALLGIYRLALQVCWKRDVAVAATACVALYPVFFMQSAMAHLDVAAAAFTLWGLNFFLRGRATGATALFALAALAKETAIVTPLALVAGELVARWRGWSSWPHFSETEGGSNLRFLWVLLAAAPLSLWFGYHGLRTGYVLGNPEYLRYNLEATLDPVRIFLAGVRRLWQTVGHMNLFVLTVAAALAMRRTPRRQGESSRRRTSFPVQRVFAVVIAAHVALFSVLGGAPLARYLLPAFPLVAILCVSTLHRRLRRWRLVVGAVCLAFVLAWFVHPPWPFAPEDNLAWRDSVLLHQRAADFVSVHYPGARVLTAWPATDELSKPYLGYVSAPLRVVPVENFSRRHVDRAAAGERNYDVVLAFSTKQQPSFNLLHRLPAWESLESRFFGYHRDVTPDEAARIFQGKVVFSEQRGGQWVAVIDWRERGAYVFGLTGSSTSGIPAPRGRFGYRP